jgi:prophage regulatory protein
MGPTKTNSAATAIEVDDDLILWKVTQVLQVIPVSRSTWFEGVRTGWFPQPLRLSKRVIFWRRADIRALIARPVNEGA